MIGRVVWNHHVGKQDDDKEVTGRQDSAEPYNRPNTVPQDKLVLHRHVGTLHGIRHEKYIMSPFLTIND